MKCEVPVVSGVCGPKLHSSTVECRRDKGGKGTIPSSTGRPKGEDNSVYGSQGLLTVKNHLLVSNFNTIYYLIFDVTMDSSRQLVASGYRQSSPSLVRAATS